MKSEYIYNEMSLPLIEIRFEVLFLITSSHALCRVSIQSTDISMTLGGQENIIIYIGCLRQHIEYQSREKQETEKFLCPTSNDKLAARITKQYCS